MIPPRQISQCFAYTSRLCILHSLGNLVNEHHYYFSDFQDFVQKLLLHLDVSFYFISLFLFWCVMELLSNQGANKDKGFVDER